MILSNAEVHRALDDGWLVLDPEPLPKMPDESGQECPYQTSAVDLRLGNEISSPGTIVKRLRQWLMVNRRDLMDD